MPPDDEGGAALRLIDTFSKPFYISPDDISALKRKLDDAAAGAVVTQEEGEDTADSDEHGGNEGDHEGGQPAQEDD